MSAKNSLQDLIQLTKNSNSITIAIGYKQKDQIAVQRLQVHDEVIESFRKDIQRKLKSYSVNTVIKKYEPAYKPDNNELLSLDINASANISSVLKLLSTPSNLELFTEDKAVIEQLIFYSVIIEQAKPKMQIITFRVFSPKKELSRGKFMALLLKHGTYSRVDQNIFLFDSEIDCFMWANFIYIIRLSNFQKIFQYLEELQNKAEKIITKISKKVLIHNIDEFRSACLSQTLMAEKLSAIEKKPYFKNITITDIKKTIRDFNLPLKLEMKNEEEGIVFESHPQKRWLILKLFDDDYLGSTMTGQQYEVNSKTVKS